MHDEENTSDENFNNIMESITSKLTGNDKEDIPYLLDKIDEYKGHKYETEINRACWRIIYKLTPYEMKNNRQSSAQREGNARGSRVQYLQKEV